MPIPTAKNAPNIRPTKSGRSAPSTKESFNKDPNNMLAQTCNTTKESLPIDVINPRSNIRIVTTKPRLNKGNKGRDRGISSNQGTISSLLNLRRQRGGVPK
eukprot:11855693-Karenia_brevis.AAC.1